MLNFGKNLLHLLNKNHFKFDTNLMVDLRGTSIWNKTPEALSWKSFHELHYKHPISDKRSSLTTNPMMLKFGENLLHLLNKNFLSLTQIQRWIWEEKLFEIKL
jgi:hypothetical protein